MAVMYKGNKVEALAYEGKKIETLWYKGKKIYSSKVAAGTVTWQGPKAFIKSTSELPDWDGKGISDTLLIDQTIELSRPISKLKNGLTVNVDPQLLQATINWSKVKWANVPADTIPTSSIPNSVNLSIEDLVAQTLVQIAFSGTQYTVSIRALDDTHLQCFATNTLDSSFNRYDSTFFAHVGVNGGLSYDYMLMIDSIVAY